MGRIKIGRGLLYYAEHPHTVKFHTLTLKRFIVKTDKESGIRPVNINQIKWLIYNGVKYIVA